MLEYRCLVDPCAVGVKDHELLRISHKLMSSSQYRVPPMLGYAAANYRKLNKEEIRRESKLDEPPHRERSVQRVNREDPAAWSGVRTVTNSMFQN
jgi:hypothetical protein